MARIVFADDKKTRNILLPGEFQKISRREIIEVFLKEWLTEKQLASCEWYKEMLDAFATEVLFHSQVDKILKKESFQFHGSTKNYPLVIVPSKPKIMKIDLEELDGDLAAGAKVLAVSDVKKEEIPPRLDLIPDIACGIS